MVQYLRDIDTSTHISGNGDQPRRQTPLATKCYIAEVFHVLFYMKVGTEVNATRHSYTETTLNLNNNLDRN